MDNFPRAFAIRQLGKGQDSKVFGTGQRAHAVIASVADNDSDKRRPWQEIHQLREQGCAGVHGESSGKSPPEFAKNESLFMKLYLMTAQLTGQ